MIIFKFNYFQGFEIWPDGSGIGYANAAFLETLRLARPGTADRKNHVAVSLYKARRTHGGQASLYRRISKVGALPFTDVKFMLQKYEDMNDPNVRFYMTDKGVMTEREKTMMHNKFVAVADTSAIGMTSVSSGVVMAVSAEILVSAMSRHRHGIAKLLHVTATSLPSYFTSLPCHCHVTVTQPPRH